MAFYPDSRSNRPPSPYCAHPGYAAPTEEFELMRSPQSDTLSPLGIQAHSKGQAVYQNIHEVTPYYENLSQQNLVRPELDPPCKPTPWQKGFFKRFPWLGVFALILAFLCMAGTVVVLISSNQKPVTEWKVQPTVILAILSAIFNASLGFALSQGAGISWWHRALKGGTVADLSREWSFGTSAKAALLSGRHFNLMALASLMVLLAVIDGPLLQRASTIAAHDLSGPINLNVALAPQLPRGYTSGLATAGFTSSGALNPSVILPEFSQVLHEYQKNLPIKNGITGCIGNCSATVQAAGFQAVCGSPVATPFTPDPLSDDEPGPLFSVSAGWHVENCTSGASKACSTNYMDGGTEVLTLNIGYVQPSGDSCYNGYFVSTTCNITQAVVEYPVKVDGNVVTLVNPTSKLTVVGLSNDRAYNQMLTATLSGFYLAATDLFGSDVTLEFQHSVGGYKVIDLNTFPSQYYASGNTTGTGICPGQIKWNDPTDDILNALNEIMFRSAIRAGANTTETFDLETPSGTKQVFSSASTIEGTHTTTQNIFQTKFVFLIAAAAVMTSGILAVLPTFYGWWDLGRDVSLNPIETAKAFDAPILGGAAALSNADVELLVKTIGKRRLVYGEHVQGDGNGEKKLTFGILGTREVS